VNFNAPVAPALADPGNPPPGPMREYQSTPNCEPAPLSAASVSPPSTTFGAEKGFVHVDVRQKARYYCAYTATAGEPRDMGMARTVQPLGSGADSKSDA
jgi:hypothetical protein